MEILKQADESFVLGLIEGLNPIDAYLRARPGRSRKVASACASRLQKTAKVQRRISEIRLAAAERAGVTAERIIEEYAKLAFCDIRQAFDPAGNLKPITELDDLTAGAIAGVEFEEITAGRGEERVTIGRLAKLKLSDKRAALADLAKIKGMFQDAGAQVSVNTGGGGVLVIQDLADTQ